MCGRSSCPCSSFTAGFVVSTAVVSTVISMRSPLSTSELLGDSRAHERGIVPSQLRDRVRHFLEPAVVDVAAVIHRRNCATSTISGDSSSAAVPVRRPKRVRHAASGIGVERKAFCRASECAPRIHRAKSATRPSRDRPADWSRGKFPGPTPGLPPWAGRASLQHVDFRDPAEERQNHRLNRQIEPPRGERVAPDSR